MRSIGLNLVTLKDGQEARLLPENLDRVRGAGFQGVGLWVPTIEEWLRAGRSLAEMREEINCRGLGVDEICAVSVLDQSGKVADRRRIFEWARELGCGRIVSIYGNPNNPLEKAREDWAAFVAQVEDTGVSPAFEFIGPWPRYHSPLEAWQVIQAGPELGSMVFDTFHFWRGGCDLEQLGKVPGERISLVHLNDVKEVAREKAVDQDRTYPGEGGIPLKQVLRGLLDSGFRGPFSVEIFGEVQQQDPDEVCAHAYRCAANVLEGL
jgi:4-hydroxyphenylpyruvate dioxygenase